MTETIHVEISEPMSVSQLLTHDIFEEDYYYYEVHTQIFMGFSMKIKDIWEGVSITPSMENSVLRTPSGPNYIMQSHLYWQPKSRTSDLYMPSA